MVTPVTPLVRVHRLVLSGSHHCHFSLLHLHVQSGMGKRQVQCLVDINAPLCV